MKTRKHESEGNELLAGFSEAKFKFNDARPCVFRGLMRLVPLENLLGTRRIDVFKAIYSPQLGTTSSIPHSPHHSELQSSYTSNMSAHGPLGDPTRNAQQSLFQTRPLFDPLMIAKPEYILRIYFNKILEAGSNK